MPYPSDQMREWCRRIHELINVPGRGTGHTDGFCHCEVHEAIAYAPTPESQAELAAGLFWRVWIDQILRRILRPGGTVGDPGFYEELRRLYPLPRLYGHHFGDDACPAIIFTDTYRTYPVPSRELLCEDKREFWGEVAAWLDSIDRSDVRDAATLAFKEDLGLRFPPELSYLFTE